MATDSPAPTRSAWLQPLLEPGPGRSGMAVRLTLTTLLVITLSMSFQLPYLAVSICSVFYTVQSNSVMTRLAGIIIIASIPLTLGAELLLLKYTFDYPLLRLILASLLFFLAVYLMRIINGLGFMFFGLAIVILYVQSFPNLIGLPDYLVRQVLWANMAVVYPTALALLVNTLFPMDVLAQWRHGVTRQLDELCATLGGTNRSPLTAADLRVRASTLQKLSQLAGLAHTSASEQYYRDQVEAVLARMLLAANTPGALTAPSPPARHLVAELSSLGESLATGRRYRTGWQPSAQEYSELRQNAALGQIHAALAELGDLDSEIDPPPKAKPALLAADVSSNPVYVRHALKALLCSLLAYLIYSSLDWQGIHTIMLTCAIVAMPGLGASVRKMSLRFTGALLGSAAALLLCVFILPRLDGLTGLLAVLPIVAGGAWIAAGPERIAYIGTQMVFTLSLALLEHFGPTNDLTEIRDRMLGILFGIALCSLVFRFIWPESEEHSLRKQASDLLHQLASLVRTQDLHSLKQCWLQIEACRDTLERMELEADIDPALVEQAGLLLTRSEELLLLYSQADQAAALEPEAQLRQQAEAIRQQIIQQLEYKAGQCLDAPARSEMRGATLPSAEELASSPLSPAQALFQRVIELPSLPPTLQRSA